MSTLADEYPKQQERLRKLLDVYKEIGPNGAFGHAAISAVLNRANKAAVEHDTVAMIRCFQEMKECQ